MSWHVREKCWSLNGYPDQSNGTGRSAGRGRGNGRGRSGQMVNAVTTFNNQAPAQIYRAVTTANNDEIMVAQFTQGQLTQIN